MKHMKRPLLFPLSLLLSILLSSCGGGSSTSSSISSNNKEDSSFSQESYLSKETESSDEEKTFESESTSESSISEDSSSLEEESSFESEESTSESEETTMSSQESIDAATYYDFSSLCYKHLDYFANNLKDRDVEYIGENEHNAAKEYIMAQLIKAGYKNIRGQSFTYRGKKCGNVVCSIKGEDSTKKIVIGAHYDGDGVGDNASGVSLLLGVLEGLKGITPKVDVDIVFFDAEEVGEYGSYAYVNSLSDDDIDRIEFMVNVDAIAFGDYPNIYGGRQDMYGDVSGLSAYNLTVEKLTELGFNMMGTEELDGYFSSHSNTGPTIEENTFYTNPWTKDNPPPINEEVYSPTTIDASDHVPFNEKGIDIVYFEATNWFAAGNGGYLAYTGYYETYDTSLGEDGMFMNTEYDTIENLESYFPGRAMAHFKLYSPLLSSLFLNPLDSSTSIK